ncbi:hypothetical protein [Kribbella sp. NPDC055071]
MPEHPSNEELIGVAEKVQALRSLVADAGRQLATLKAELELSDADAEVATSRQEQVAMLEELHTTLTANLEATDRGLRDARTDIRDPRGRG